MLEHASPIACSKERLVLGYEPGSFFAIQATEGVSVDVLTRTVRAFFGAPTQIAFDLSVVSGTKKGGSSIAAIDQELRREQIENAKRSVAEHPLVRAIVDVLAAEIREIRLPE